MPRLRLFPVRNARIIVSTFKSDWLAMRVPRQMARSPSSCSASQKLSQPFSVWRRLLSTSSRAAGDSLSERLTSPLRGLRHGFFSAHCLRFCTLLFFPLHISLFLGNFRLTQPKPILLPYDMALLPGFPTSLRNSWAVEAWAAASMVEADMVAVAAEADKAVVVVVIDDLT